MSKPAELWVVTKHVDFPHVPNPIIFGRWVVPENWDDLSTERQAAHLDAEVRYLTLGLAEQGGRIDCAVWEVLQPLGEVQ